MRRAISITITLLGAFLAATGLASAGSVDELTGRALSEEKTRAEIRALRQGDDGPDYTAIAGLVTAAVAAVGLVLTLRKQITETAAQREADRAAKAEAAERRYDEQFNGLTQHLGAEQPATRVGAAVGVTRFLRPQHSEFHDDVTRLLIAHLKVQDDPTTLAVLRRGLERAFRLGSTAPDDRDLSNAKLDARIAPEAYGSITRALNWRGAHFDERVRDELEALAGGRS